MTRRNALILSTVVTGLLLIIVLVAGQSHAQAGTPQTNASAVVADPAQSAPVNDAFTLSQPQGSSNYEHDGNEHRSRGTSNFYLDED